MAGVGRVWEAVRAVREGHENLRVFVTFVFRRDLRD
jgi:hypothetical protein